MLVSTDLVDAVMFAQHMCHCQVRLASEAQLHALWRSGALGILLAHIPLSPAGVSDWRPAAPLLAIGSREQKASTDFFILLADHPAVADDRALQVWLALALTTVA